VEEITKPGLAELLVRFAHEHEPSFAGAGI